MITELKSVTVKGKVEKDVYGTFDDVIKGMFIDRDSMETIFWRFLDRNVTITITETPEQEV